jgi:hypothetical protein
VHDGLIQSADGKCWTKIYRQGGDVVTRKIAGELFIVPVSGNLANMQKMFALTPVGAYIWSLLDGHRPLSDLRDTVLLTYNVEKSQAELDIRELVADLLGAGLIREEKE